MSDSTMRGIQRSPADHQVSQIGQTVVVRLEDGNDVLVLVEPINGRLPAAFYAVKDCVMGRFKHIV